MKILCTTLQMHTLGTDHVYSWAVREKRKPGKALHTTTPKGGRLAAINTYKHSLNKGSWGISGGCYWHPVDGAQDAAPGGGCSKVSLKTLLVERHFVSFLPVSRKETFYNCQKQCYYPLRERLMYLFLSISCSHKGVQIRLARKQA